MLYHEFYLYILECNDKSYYIGHTDNIEKRIAEHAEGLSSYTSKKLPVKVVYTESFQLLRSSSFVEHSG